MNKIIPFNKDIKFNERIGEIESIALDDTLKFLDNYTIKGELIVRGCHKNDNIEKDFSYPLPVEISVDDKYDTSKSSIVIDDFYYEIINDDLLRVKIDLMLDDLYYKEEKKEKEVREVNYDKEENLKQEEKINDILEITPEEETIEEENIDLSKETSNNTKEYCVYRVYVFKDNDTLSNIIDKYKVTKEELEEINDLSKLKVGDKIIIPSIDE